MLYRFDMWDRFRQAAYWWIDAMVAVWVTFTRMLFIVEPFNLHRRLLGRSEPEGQIAFRRVERLHRILLIISLLLWVATVCCCSNEQQTGDESNGIASIAKSHAASLY